MIPLLLIVITLEAYVLGSLNSTIIISRYVYHRDVRSRGSRKANYANFGRLFGKKQIAVPVIVDIGKSVVAILLGAILMLPCGGFTVIGKLYAGFILIIGDMFPIQTQLRGSGRGYIPFLVTLWLADWRMGLTATVIFVLVLAFTQYLSLSFMAACASGVLAAWIFVDSTQLKGLSGVIVLFMLILLLWRNRGTIFKLIAHKEKKVRWGRKTENVLRADRNF